MCFFDQKMNICLKNTTLVLFENCRCQIFDTLQNMTLIMINTLDVNAVNLINLYYEQCSIVNIKRVCKQLSCTLLAIAALNANAELPIYAAYVSDTLEQECKISDCELNVLNAESLSELVTKLDNSADIAGSLALSDYEVLIGNALLTKLDENKSELVLEITTSWREVPIDDFVLRLTHSNDKLNQTALEMIKTWASHLESQGVLSANRIYQVLGASDYNTELKVPSAIGEFMLVESAIYRDPLLGSITRYTHPQYNDAVVDISVYPLSPFAHKDFQKQREMPNSSDYLRAEMQSEVDQISELIAHAKIEDYKISNIETANIELDGQMVEGVRLEVLLNTASDPIYNTQYLFQQNDKLIKLTGNLPGFMMTKLVSESLGQIEVPSESAFMRGLRQG